MNRRELARRRKQLVLDLLRLKDEAGRVELWGTMHAIDGATTKIGWEIASKDARAPEEEKEGKP